MAAHFQPSRSRLHAGMELSHAQQSLAGFMSGAAACTLCYPLDTLRWVQWPARRAENCKGGSVCSMVQTVDIQQAPERAGCLVGWHGTRLCKSGNGPDKQGCVGMNATTTQKPHMYMHTKGGSESRMQPKHRRRLYISKQGQPASQCWCMLQSCFMSARSNNPWARSPLPLLHNPAVYFWGAARRTCHTRFCSCSRSDALLWAPMLRAHLPKSQDGRR